MGNDHIGKTQAITHLRSTAAIQYRNSTIVDIVQVNGTPAYKRAMKTMADDANAIRHGFPSML